VVLPALDARYREYLAETDQLMDAPTVRILERILLDDARMVRESRELRGSLPALSEDDASWSGLLGKREAAVRPLVVPPAPAKQAS
jgi:hypothetical protein